ncbi:MAG TPA: proline iminopeptidase-family hydrolase [Solirubrobacteraceae bacterium]|nr:proline iminopeptidase-family hydrolase [Solirubrobacteraceae bacterium]
MHEATLNWSRGWTWYRVVEGADESRVPLVLLHGGPGAGADYIEPISELAERSGRTCVLYDQLGCGRSQHLPQAPAEFWTPALFLEELAAIVEHLGIAGRHNILGQSWGGMLGMEYAVTHPAGLNALIVANSPASMRLWVTEANRLRAELPAEVQATLLAHEQAGTTDDPAYEEAMMPFYERHVCRVVPFPAPFQRTFDVIAADPTVYHTMNGPSEFHVVGSLTDWDITPHLPRIAAPTLVISGEFDEATPAVVEPLVEAIPGARWELMAGASHCSHLEQPEAFLTLVEDFLTAQD